jgi:hypothetical protein
MLPTATGSPTRKPVTSPPTAATSPTNSCPGTSGADPAVRASAACRSLWHTPHHVTSTAMSSGRNSRRSKRYGVQLPPGAVKAMPVVFRMAATLVS